MKGTVIKQMSNWPVLEAALESFAQGAGLPPAIVTAIADRLRAAIEAPDAARADTAASLLEQLYRELVAEAPAAVRDAARGMLGTELAASYALGKVAFAQLLAARVADTRADARFAETLRDPRYLPYVEALRAGPLSVGALQEKVGTRTETVSRKLAVLRGLGIIVSRRQGNSVVNTLTPAACQLLGELVSDSDMGASPAVAAREALDAKREALPEHLRHAANFALARQAA